MSALLVIVPAAGVVAVLILARGLQQDLAAYKRYLSESRHR